MMRRRGAGRRTAAGWSHAPAVAAEQPRECRTEIHSRMALACHNRRVVMARPAEDKRRGCQVGATLLVFAHTFAAPEAAGG